MYQIGEIPGHQASEHLFTLKSVMSHYMNLKIPLILQCYDIKKYFFRGVSFFRGEVFFLRRRRVKKHVAATQKNIFLKASVYFFGIVDSCYKTFGFVLSTRKQQILKSWWVHPPQE